MYNLDVSGGLFGIKRVAGYRNVQERDLLSEDGVLMIANPLKRVRSVSGRFSTRKP